MKNQLLINLFNVLNQAWDEEPETLIELGITDGVFKNLEAYVMEDGHYRTEDDHTKMDCPICEGAEHVDFITENGMCDTCIQEKKD